MRAGGTWLCWETFGACVGHVDFMLFVSFTPALLANADMVSGGIWAFIVRHL